MFNHQEAADIYPAFMTAVMEELRPARLIDGPDTEMVEFKDEVFARFAYYRNPENFARSFMALMGLEGDSAEVTEALRDIAERDALTQTLYGRRPKARQLEEGGDGPRKYKRLRFSEDGAIIFEDGRFAVGDPNIFGETACGLQQELAKMLVETGVARPAKSVVQKKV